jgi:hypothetical protein
MGLPANFTDLPTHWVNPPADPDPMKTKFNCFIELPRGSVEFDQVERDLDIDLRKGFDQIRKRKILHVRYHGDYIRGDILADSFKFKVVKIWRAQFGLEYLHQKLYEQELLLKFGPGAVKCARVYHGTSKVHAFSIAETGPSRFRTTVRAHGQGVYFCPFGEIALHHALSYMCDGRFYLLVCDLVYHKIGRTFNGSTKPPFGTDCGACCEPDINLSATCMMVSFKDSQVRVTHVVECECA